MVWRSWTRLYFGMIVRTHTTMPAAIVSNATVSDRPSAKLDAWVLSIVPTWKIT